MSAGIARRASGQGTTKYGAIERYAPVVAIVALPAIALLTLGNPINQAGGLDAFIYTALVHDYSDVLARYGRTYYSTRIAFIYPARLFVGIFGTEAGYYLVRYLMLVAGTASLYGIARRFANLEVALFAAVGLTFSPWILRSVMWDHYDGFAAIYLLAGCYFLFVPRANFRVSHVAAGACYAAAVNCNFFNLAIGGLLLPAWLFMNARLAVAETLTRLFLVAVGFVAASLLLALTVYYEFPELGLALEQVTINMVSWLLGGGASNWFHPFSEFARVGVYFPLAVVSVLAGGVAWLVIARPSIRTNEADRFTVAMLGYLALCVALFLVMHYVFRSGIIFYFYYVVFCLPAAMIVSVCVIGRISATVPRPMTIAILAGFGVACFVLWIGADAWRPALAAMAPMHFLLLALGVPASILLYRFSPALALVGACALIIVQPAFFYTSAHYSGLHARHQAGLERDVYDGAIHLQGVVAETVPPEAGQVGFWYANAPTHMYLNSVQSTHLWGFSRLGSTDREQPGMPVIDRYFLDRVPSDDFIVLLAIDESEFAAAETALEEQGIGFVRLRDDRFEGTQWGYYLRILELLPEQIPASPPLYEFPLASFGERNGATLSATDDGVAIVGSPRTHNYSFVRPLVPPGMTLTGPAVVAISITLKSGRFGVGVLARGSSSEFIQEVAIANKGRQTDVILRLEDIAEAGDLVIREAAQEGGSTAEIHRIKVSRPD